VRIINRLTCSLVGVVILGAVASAPAVASALDFYLPWTQGSTVRCSQGNGGAISHTSVGGRYAWDFAMSLGDPIRAAAPGTVIALRQDAADFVPNPDMSTPVNYVLISHSDGTRTGYLHLKQNSLPADIRVGATVRQGQIIGGAGSSGFSSGVHLHFTRWDTAGVSIPLSFVEAGVPVGGVRYVSANSEAGSPPPTSPDTTPSVDVPAWTSTRTSIGVSGTLRRSRTVTIYGYVSPGAVGDTVAVYMRRPGSRSWTRIRTVATYATSGRWATPYRLRYRGTYYFRAVFVGAPYRHASSSGDLRKRVR
jgi:hypothetical protein